MTTAPHPIDTDALRKLEQAATPGPWENDTTDDRDIDFNWQLVRGPDDKVLFDCLNSDAAVIHEEGDENGISRWDETGLRNCDLIVAARNALPAILDELDRLSAAEAAAKARVEDWEEQAYENGVHAIRLQFELADARAEIARLTDAGAEKPKACTCHPDDNPPVPCPQRYALSECRAAALAPPPPAAADRGVPGQEDDNALSQEAIADAVRLAKENPSAPWSSAFVLQLAALATAPKAEDVRRETFNEAIDLAVRAGRGGFAQQLRALVDRPAS